MATVQPAERMWSRQNSTANVTEQFRKLTVSFTEAYSILTSYDAAELDIYNNAGLPRPRQSYPGFPYVLAGNAQLQRISPIYWIATITYTGEIGGIDTAVVGPYPATSPLSVPPRITVADVEVEEEIDQDFDGQPIVTPAGERVRGVKSRFPDQTLTVTRNLPSFNSYVQAVYRRSVNSDLFFNWPPGTCKLMQLTGQNVLDQNLGYWQVTGVFQFRYPYNTTPDKAWYYRYPAMGLYQKNASGKQVPCIDGNRNPVATPAYLDANGRQTTADSVFFQETKLYGSLPYNLLGLL